MSTQNQTQKNDRLSVVYIVSCYQNVVGVYADAQDAFAVQMDYIHKNRPAAMCPFTISYSEKLG